MATKAQLDAKWGTVHKNVSVAYTALPNQSRVYNSSTWLLFQKWHTWLTASWMLEYLTNGVSTGGTTAAYWNTQVSVASQSDRDALAQILGVAVSP